MKKRIVACMLVAAMVLGMTACGGGSSDTTSNDGTTYTVSNEYEEREIDGITYHVATDLTDEEISLVVLGYDDEEMTNALADRFMELYPNISVTVIIGNQDDYSALVADGTPPDIMTYTDADFLFENGVAMDITSLWESDDETDELASTIAETGMGTFQTGHQFAVPIKYYPGIMYVDANVLKKFNLEQPDNSWTWDEMIEIIKTCTDTISGVQYYGLGYYNRLDSYYGIAAGQEYWGEFGYDGYDFDLSSWAIGEQQMADLKIAGNIAPSQNTQEMEDWLEDWSAWCGTTGQVAVFSEAFWTFQNLWNTDEYKENYDLDIYPLVVPAVSEEDASDDHHTIANIDFACIVDSCQYPREAYELLKFISFGRDGWLTRISIYGDEDSTKSDGTSWKVSNMPAPITTNEEVWDAYIEMYCAGMDDEHRTYWEEYFASCMQPIPFGWLSIAGYYTACVDYFNNISAGGYTGIHNIVDANAGKASDYVDEAQRQFNYYHANAMIQYFGPNGYNVLSDEDLESYEELLEANS